jgi:hypothetical protein
MSTHSHPAQTHVAASTRSAPWLDPRYLLAAAGGTALVAGALGIPTDVIPNPWFTRMIPAETLNYLFWIGTSVLTGALLATYTLPPLGGQNLAGPAMGSGLLGLLAAGCPVCNKLVVTLLGVSGALSYFAPIQPLLGAVALLLAAGALNVRLRASRRACRRPVATVRGAASR